MFYLFTQRCQFSMYFYHPLSGCTCNVLLEYTRWQRHCSCLLFGWYLKMHLGFRLDRILSSLNPWRAEFTLEYLKYICDFYKYSMIIMYATNSWIGMKETKYLYSHFASFYMDVISYSCVILNAVLHDLCWFQRPQVAYFSLHEYPLASWS